MRPPSRSDRTGRARREAALDSGVPAAEAGTRTVNRVPGLEASFVRGEVTEIRPPWPRRPRARSPDRTRRRVTAEDRASARSATRWTPTTAKTITDAEWTTVVSKLAADEDAQPDEQIG